MLNQIPDGYEVVKLWKPQPGPQTEFFTSKAFEIFYGGGVGGGKTDSLIIDGIRDVNDPNYTGIIFRSLRSELEWIIRRSRYLIDKLVPGSKLNESKLIWKFPQGSELHYGYLERDADVHKYEGRPYQYMGFDELPHFSKFQYTYLKNWCRATAENQHCRVRASGMPLGKGVDWVKDYFVKHGPYKEYKDPDTGLVRVYIPATIDDNKILRARQPNYGENLKALGQELYHALRHADWTQIVGAAFKELNLKEHSIPAHAPPRGVRIFRGGDWGFERPFAFYWAYQDFDGKIIVFYEYYGTTGEPNKGVRLSSREVAKEIKRIDEMFRGPDDTISGPLDPACWGKQDDTNSVAENFALEGVNFYPAKTNRMLGKMEFHTRLSKENGGPHIKFNHDLKHFWRTVPALQIDKRKSEDINSDMEDHSYDTIRYMIMDVPMVASQDYKSPEPEFYGERITGGMDW